jgi:hypothetical protein
MGDQRGQRNTQRCSVFLTENQKIPCKCERKTLNNRRGSPALVQRPDVLKIVVGKDCVVLDDEGGVLQAGNAGDGQHVTRGLRLYC